jgi:hypothetical protein
MALPELEEFTSMLARAKAEGETWGDLFEMVRVGQLSDSDAERSAAIKYLSESGLIPIISEWSFHSSPVLDQVALRLGAKSWQLTEFVETAREMLSISEADLGIPKDVSIREDLKGDGLRSKQSDFIGEEQDELIWISPKEIDESRRSVLENQRNNNVNTQLRVLWLLLGLMISLVLVLLYSNRFSQNQDAPKETSLVPTDPAQSGLPQDRFQRDGSSRNSFQKPQSDLHRSLWQACEQDSMIEKASPQTGETWWPVVGPPEALQEAKLYCRSDAFVSARTGKVQISSFRDRSVAVRFSELLTSDNSHPWTFEVGPPRVIGEQ